MTKQAALSPVERLSKTLLAELNAMKDIGMDVPEKAIKMASDLPTVSEYENSDLSVGDIADLLCDLARC